MLHRHTLVILESADNRDMKNTLYISLGALLIASQAMAATAYYAGRQENVTTVTGQMAIKCLYQYNGQKFWETFVGQYTCPMSVEVQ